MSPDLAVAVGGVVLLLAYFGVERWFVARDWESTPVLIAVTGTRGKSSVVRLIAAGLDAADWRVVAKTTGSQAAVTLPGGKEIPLVRRGTPTILEQKAILRRARSERARAVVIEVMSVRPENYAVELGHLLRPHVLAITNIRPDHVADLGSSAEEAAVQFSRGVPRGCQVVLVHGESPPALAANLQAGGLEVMRVGPDAYQEEAAAFPHTGYGEWEENLRLALAVCEACGVSPKTAAQGMAQVRPDFGALRARRLVHGRGSWVVVNAFAANDPISTIAVHRRVRGSDLGRELPMVGFFNVRGDRGDRTEQWVRTLTGGGGPEFVRLWIGGDYPQAVARRLRGRMAVPVGVVATRDPLEVMTTVSESDPGDALLFGFGNIGGVGAALVNHWDEVGEPACL